MRIRDEELVQFLLGEADQRLRVRVQESLAADPSVSKRLAELRAALGLLDSLKLSAEPPSDLVSRTMMRIDADAAAELEAAQRHGQQANSACGSGKRAELQRASSAVPAGTLRSSRQLWDTAILSMSIVAMCCLMLPVILTARAQSRRLQCAYNVRSLGRGLTELALLNHEQRYPTVPNDGPESFVGYLAAHLKESDLLESPAVLKCPSLGPRSTSTQLLPVPTREEFCKASPQHQQYWRLSMGGNYAFPLGVRDGHRVTGARLEGRTYFALLSDTPRFENDEEVFVAHDGGGINIYYEDGHVAFVPVARVKALERHLSRRNYLTPALSGRGVLPSATRLYASDAPFHNIDGERARGLDRNDAVLGPSYASPHPSILPK